MYTYLRRKGRAAAEGSAEKRGTQFYDIDKYEARSSIDMTMVYVICMVKDMYGLFQKKRTSHCRGVSS